MTLESGPKLFNVEKPLGDFDAWYAPDKRRFSRSAITTLGNMILVNVNYKPADSRLSCAT